MRVHRVLLLVLLFLFARNARATSIPNGLTPTDVERLTRLIAMGGTTRLLRTAEAYAPWPGLKIGAELTFFPGDRIGVLGNQNGAAASFLPIPRIHLSKGLFDRWELVGSFFFGGLNTVSSVGALVKWTAQTEADSWMSIAFFGGGAGTYAFQGEFEGSNAEAGVVISKDYVRFRPYAGASLIFAKGGVLPALATSTRTTGTLIGSHLFFGTEWELPVNLSVQLDLTNLDPSISFFVGKKF